MAGLTLADGSPVELGALIAKAGEGTVYEVAGQPDSVLKVFHPTLSGFASKLDKVAAMAATTPRGAVQSDGFPVLTWPQQPVLDGDRPVGYVMARADTATAVEIHTLSNPSNRAKPLPGAPRWTSDATWAHLVNTAANLCLAVQVVHRVDAVIGDFQERNVLVSDTTRVTLVDCDSMQFTDAAGRQFLCGVARPEFTAPEVAGLNLRTQAREKSSDYFALAVHIYLLLMAGNHPFQRGTWTGPGEQPSALELARSGDWAGGPDSRLKTHPLAPPPSFLPAEVQELFERAFTAGAKDPSQRPSAAQWRKALLDITFTTCKGVAAHQVPAGCSDCPWCAIDQERLNRRRDLDDDIPDQVIYTAPKSARVLAKATTTWTKSSAPTNDSRARASASAARIARAQRLAAGVSVAGTASPIVAERFAGGVSSIPGASQPAAGVRRKRTFAILGVSISILVGVVCAILILGGIAVEVNTSPASSTLAPQQPGTSPVEVYNASNRPDTADRVAAQLRDGGWTVFDVRSLPPMPQIASNTVYYSDSPTYRATAESIGVALKLPAEPRPPDLPGSALGVVVVVVQ